MRSVVASRKGINISGHYVVSMIAIPFPKCTLNFRK